MDITMRYILQDLVALYFLLINYGKQIEILY
ncbi:hypothetical protein Bhyg_02834, partial [Pseudolycoriella hygida]